MSVCSWLPPVGAAIGLLGTAITTYQGYAASAYLRTAQRHIQAAGDDPNDATKRKRGKLGRYMRASGTWTERQHQWLLVCLLGLFLSAVLTAGHVWFCPSR